jgi:hypothetical protein
LGALNGGRLAFALGAALRRLPFSIRADLAIQQPPGPDGRRPELGLIKDGSHS